MDTTQLDENANSNLPSLLPRNLVPLAQKFLLGFGAIAAFVSLFGDLSEGGGLIDEWFIKNSLYINSILHLALIILVLFPGRLMINDFHAFRKFFNSKKNNKQPFDEKDRNDENQKIKEVNNKKDQNDSKIDEKNIVAKIEDISKSFITYWTFIWLSWGGLYAVFFLGNYWNQQKATINDPSKELDLIINFLLRFFNNFGTVCMALLILVLFPKVYGSFKNYLESFDSKPIKFLKKKKWDIVLVFITTIFLCYEFFEGFMLCWIEDVELIVVMETILSYSAGVAAAVAFAMIAGRLDSFYFSAKQYWVILIFLYATLQPAFPTYTETARPIIKATIAYSAFTLKGFFYVFVFNQFENWRIFYYYFGYYGDRKWIREQPHRQTIKRNKLRKVN